jgi:hypothetical protein
LVDSGKPQPLKISGLTGMAEALRVDVCAAVVAAERAMRTEKIGGLVFFAWAADFCCEVRDQDARTAVQRDPRFR